jgi:biotin carboxylase
VLFLGMVRRGEFESLQHRGLPLGILVDTNSKHRLADVSGFALVERFDFSRPVMDLLEAVQNIQKRLGVQCLFNVIEFYVAQTAYVAAALGIPSISTESARLCRDKILMRNRFHERIGSSSVARFREVTSQEDLMEFTRETGYPVFLQPANVAASMWATRNDDQETLLANYRAILAEVPSYYDQLGNSELAVKVSVAEYLNGPNSSIDCLVDQRGHVYSTPVVDVLTGQDIGVDDYHHFARILPSQRSARDQEELDRLALAGVQALDMTTCAAHVEFIGSRLGEIAARPGGNRPRILELAYGMDEIYAYYQVLIGETPTLIRKSHNAAALITPYPSTEGTLRAINYLDQLADLPGYLYHEVRTQPGHAVGMAKSGHRPPLYVELMSPNVDEVRRGVDQLASWSDIYVVE